MVRSKLWHHLLTMLVVIYDPSSDSILNYDRNQFYSTVSTIVLLRL
jgi:hypothetical protein